MQVIDHPLSVLPFIPSPARRIIHEKYQVPPPPAAPAAAPAPAVDHYRAQRLAPATVPESPYVPPHADILPSFGGSSVVHVLYRLLAMAGAVIGGLVVLGLGVALTGGCG
jgi:hypothetical protein